LFRPSPLNKLQAAKECVNMKHIHFLTLEDFAGVCFREVQARELQLLESQVCFIVSKSQCRSHLRWRVAGMFCPCFFFLLLRSRGELRGLCEAARAIEVASRAFISIGAGTRIQYSTTCYRIVYRIFMIGNGVRSVAGHRSLNKVYDIAESFSSL
jgi:hypothetical protein